MEGRVGEAAQESAVRVAETIKKSQMGTGAVGGGRGPRSAGGGGEGSVNGGGMVEDESKPGGESERGWVGAVAGCCVGQPDWARVRCVL